MHREEIPVCSTMLRFLPVMVFSLVLIWVDLRTKLLGEFHFYMETLLYPVLIFANSPNSVSEAFSTQFKTRAELIEENEALSNENYEQRVDIMRLHSLEQENAAMRKLLNSPLRVSSRRIFAEVINVDSDPYLQRLVVNRGASSGVYAGMPVITDEGLVGQVVNVAYGSSRVLLLSDPSSAIPVTNTRNQVRAIISGTGVHDELVIENMPRSTDVREGDLLVTSGFGGVYPEGYPVAIVSSVGFSEEQPFAEVKAKPLVDTDRIRYVLMFWYRLDSNVNNLAVPSKEQTDGKRVLRQEHIRQLIDALTEDERVEGRDGAELNGEQGAVNAQNATAVNVATGAAAGVAAGAAANAAGTTNNATDTRSNAVPATNNSRSQNNQRRNRRRSPRAQLEPSCPMQLWWPDDLPLTPRSALPISIPAQIHKIMIPLTGYSSFVAHYNQESHKGRRTHV